MGVLCGFWCQNEAVTALGTIMMTTCTCLIYKCGVCIDVTIDEDTDSSIILADL